MTDHTTSAQADKQETVLTDDEILRAAINASDSLNITRVHEIGGPSRTIMEDAGLLELGRAIESALLSKLRAPVAVPEECTNKLVSAHYRRGWNACRAEILQTASALVAGEEQPVCWIEKDVLESVRDEGSDAWVYWRPAGHVAEPDEMPLYAAPQASKSVVVQFAGVGSAGPFPVVDKHVTLPEVTMRDLAQRLAPQASEAVRTTDTEAVLADAQTALASALHLLAKYAPGHHWLPRLGEALEKVKARAALSAQPGAQKKGGSDAG